MKRASSPALIALIGLLACAPATGQGHWHDVSDLEHALDARDSATETLRLWCVDHQRGSDASIHAVRERVEKPPPAEVLWQLGASDPMSIHYRRVRLVCGERTLSVADNWYRADQLTPAMNEALDHTDKPFGQVVGPLGLHRRAVSSKRPPVRSGFVLQRRAVLTNDRGQPFSAVREAYTAAVLERP